MPIYEYRCRECKRRSEIITFRISEDVSARCSHCGSIEVERIPSRVRAACPRRLEWSGWPIHPAFPGSMRTIRKAWPNG